MQNDKNILLDEEVRKLVIARLLVINSNLEG